MDAQEFAAREAIVEAEMLRQEAHPRTCQPIAERRAEERRAAARGLDEPEQHLHRRGLASPVRPEKSEDFAAADAQRKIRNRNVRAELLAQRMRFDGRPHL